MMKKVIIDNIIIDEIFIKNIRNRLTDYSYDAKTFTENCDSSEYCNLKDMKTISKNFFAVDLSDRAAAYIYSKIYSFPEAT